MQSVYLNSMQVLTILNWLTVITGLLLFLILQVSLHNSAFQTCYGSLESGVVITSNLILDVIISPIIIIVPLSWSSNELHSIPVGWVRGCYNRSSYSLLVSMGRKRLYDEVSVEDYYRILQHNPCHYLPACNVSVV